MLFPLVNIFTYIVHFSGLMQFVYYTQGVNVLQFSPLGSFHLTCPGDSETKGSAGAFCPAALTGPCKLSLM